MSLFMQFFRKYFLHIKISVAIGVIGYWYPVNIAGSFRIAHCIETHCVEWLLSAKVDLRKIVYGREGAEGTR
jgi:hypothetical protein